MIVGPVTTPPAGQEGKFIFLATGAPAVGMANDLPNAKVWWVSRPGDLDIFSGIPLRFYADDENNIVYVWPDPQATHTESIQADFDVDDVFGVNGQLMVSKTVN